MMKSCSWELCQVLPPTRDIKDGAGDVGRLIRHQPDDGVGDFIRGTDALHRHHVREPVRAVRLAASGVNFSIDEPGPDGCDADTLSCDFIAKADCEGIDRAL